MSTNKKANKKVGTLSRRKFFGLSAVVGTSLAAGTLGGANSAAAETAGPSGPARPPDMRDDPTILQLQSLMASGKLTSHKLTKEYVDRIRDLDRNGPKLNSVIELNPDALDIAKALDAERKRSGPRGPLHGIPILLKDNIDTGDRMQTTAGSWALYGQPALSDSTTAARLRAAGAVILGKTNLSEFANFRAWIFTSGWSGRGGQTRNPNVLDRNPLGSSSGSAVSVAANLVTVSIGTETDGSIVLPAAVNGVVGIKPTVGLTSRAGVVPISHSQDSIGPFGRTVADAAIVLGALVGVDPRDPATQASAGRFHTDYAQFLNPDGLRGARIGVMRHLYFGNWPAVDALAEAAIQTMQAAGAVIVDPADIPTIEQISFEWDEFNVMLYEFKRDFNAYLATRTGIPSRTLAEVIAFNETHPEERLNIMDQQVLQMSQDEVVSEPDYQAALALTRSRSRQLGIDAIMDQHNLDVLIAPAFGPAYKSDWIYGDNFARNPAAPVTPPAQAGYPVMNVPLGDVFGLPIGMAFVGRAFSEPTLIRVASGFEAVIGARRPPKFLPSIEGTTAEMLLASRGRSRESAKEIDARELKKRSGAGRLAP